MGSKSSGGGGGGGRGVRVFDSVEELSTGLAEHVAQLSEAFVKQRGAFSLVLSGGADLVFFLGKLSRAPYSKTVDWLRWHVFWAEENVVPRNHPDSHYKVAKDTFLSKVSVAPSKVVPVVVAGQGSTSLSGESVAEEYEFRIRQLVRSRTVDVSRSSDCPRFDLVLLLLGPDGRVASLYPDHPVLFLGYGGDQCPWVAPVTLPSSSSSSSRRSMKKAAAEKVTMTLPVINSAAQVAVIATGTEVAEALASALGGGGNPASMVSPMNGDVVWFVDTAAASLLGDLS